MASSGKLILCAALLATVLVIVQSTSTGSRDVPFCNRNQTCVRQGAHCEQGGIPCADNLYCLNGTCINTTLGMPCSSWANCVYLPNYQGPAHFHRMSVDCVNNVCVLLKAAGDPCSDSAECAVGLPCVSGVCQGKGFNQTCHVTLENGIVVDHFECGWSLSCVPQNATNGLGFCLPWIADGQICEVGDTNFNPCGPYSYCRNGICQPGLSVATGEDCSSFGYGECSTGAYCAADGMCNEIPNFAMECHNDQDCFAFGFGNYSVCECDNVVGQNFCSPPDHDTAAMGQCTTLLQPMYQCMMASQCKSDFLPGTCAWVNCWSQWVNIISCYTDAMSTFYQTCIYAPWFITPPSPPDNGGGGGSNGGAIAGAVIGSIVGVAAVIGGILLVYKYYWSRRGYGGISENTGLTTDDSHRYAL